MIAGLADFWLRFARNRLAAGASAVLVAICFILLLTPVLPLADPAAIDLADRLMPPLTGGHLLGTDHLGRDLFARLLWGGRLSLAVALAATLAAAVVGGGIGLAAGYWPGWPDTVLMRGIDVMMAFPYLLLALAIVAVLGPGLVNALMAVAVVNIPFFARIVRGHTVGEAGRDYIAAARLSGFSGRRILATEILPNVLPAIVIVMASTMGWMILETAGLSFLGLGAQPPTADLGAMLGEGRKVVFLAPHVGAVPGIAIIVVVVALNLAADGLRDGLDPRLSAGRLARPKAMTDVVAAPGHDRQGDGDAGPVLSVRSLRTWFVTGRAPVKAVDGLGFTLDAGQSLGIVGESGSGKSVAALSILRLAPSPPACIVGGSVLYRGCDLMTAGRREMRAIRGGRIGYVFQDASTALDPLERVGDGIAGVLRRHRGMGAAAARAEAVRLMDMVRLPRPEAHVTQYPHELSGGMRQRAMLAGALAGDIDILIADEPTTALDVTTQAAILDLIAELQRERGFALIFITHDLGVLARIAERAIVMRRGRMVEEGAIADILAAPRDAYTRDLVASVPRLDAPERLFLPETDA